MDDELRRPARPKKMSAEARESLVKAGRLIEELSSKVDPDIAALGERAAALIEAARRAVPPELAGQIASLDEKIAMFEGEQPSAEPAGERGVPAESESPVQRAARLASEHAALKAKGCRNYTETLAKKEGVSDTRIRQLVAKGRASPAPKGLPKKPASPFPQP